MSPAVVPEELIAEVLSILPVKSILRFKCVCKPWEFLISDHFFVKKQLHQSQKRNMHLALILCRPHVNTISYYYDRDSSVVPISLKNLLCNPSLTITILPQHRMRYKRCFRVIGSINGLLCLFNSHIIRHGPYGPYDRDTCFRLWNPATKKISQKLGSITHPNCHPYFGGENQSNYLRFAFGYDNSTDTYKVVAFCPNEVRIFSFRDNAWKNIPCFPVVPYYRVALVRHREQRVNEGVYLNGTVNWLAIPNSKYFWGQYGGYTDPPAIDQFVIISLDLGRETYNQLLLPRDLVEVPPIFPTISVLRDCLCFSYHINTTHFAIWMMTEFGVQESWTQFLNISYADLQIDYESRRYGYDYLLHPLCLSEDDDTIILANSQEEQAFLYNWRDNRVEKTRITNNVLWMFSPNYIETLVSTC
ncbi:F-box/kelch-repeat protein At3g23880-like [Vicia villosa]|uniref:F-box/kelch-repeat protein At3g23880-like n=1 Tax=Vicia villosa TaxID=3911 RepID=UPI00273BB3F9|nr:F-box/kelch-repeat protein At3g23880-like [Vicia villosa]